jgi:hypothetical protein
MQTLDVVNEMLGTMGETPLNTLEDPHTFRGACLSTLTNMNRQIQSKGWWFNRETLELAPSALDSTIYLPGDFINVRVPRLPTGRATRNVVQRGRRLYDLDEGRYEFDKAVTVEVVRLIPFQEMPETAAQYVAAMAVLQFQSKYDGDTAKSREIRGRLEGPMGLFAAINTEETRNRQVNLIESNPRLLRLKFITKAARRLLR